MGDCGVYEIMCIPNGRRYIGSSVNMAKRFMEHRSALRNGRHHSFLLQRTWEKYGESAFRFTRLLACDADHRTLYEQIAIDVFDAANPLVGMNRDPVAKCSPPSAAFKGRQHTTESKRKISESRKGMHAWNKGIPSAQKGAKRSQEGRQRIATAKQNGVNAIINMDIARKMRLMKAERRMRGVDISAEMSVPVSIVYRVLSGRAWTEEFAA